MFFKTKDNLPEGLGFSTFSGTHIIWLLAIVLGIIAASLIYRRLDVKKRNIMRITVGVIIIFLELLKNIIVAAIGEFSFGYLPFHLCGINILLIAFNIFKRNKTVENFLYYFCIPGASLALLFPNWTGVPCFNFFHIHSFLIHGFLVMYPILLVSGKELTPEIKMMPKCILLLIVIAIPVYLMNLAWGTNFMFLMESDSGNPLEFFEKLLGSHLWGFPILLPIVMFVMYIPITIINKFCKKDTLNSEETEEKPLVKV